MVIPLSHTRSGDQGRVVWIASSPPRRKHLADLGFVPEETIRCQWKLFRGAFALYRTPAASTLLRRKTANEIFVELL